MLEALIYSGIILLFVYGIAYWRNLNKYPLKSKKNDEILEEISRMSKEEQQKGEGRKESGCSFCLLIAIIALITAGVIYYHTIMIIYYTIYFWLKEGYFIDTSLYSCFTPNKWTGVGPLSYISVSWTKTSLSQWLLNPSDWIGFHKMAVYILKSIPIYLVGIIVGTLFLWVEVLMLDIHKRYEREAGG